MLLKEALGLNDETLRSLIKWNIEYRPDWDSTADEYAENGVVQWGRSKRLGMFKLGAVKAYIGVQHVDPSVPGWAIVDGPQARFFLSLFIGGQVVTLRTFPTMDGALTALRGFLLTGSLR